MLPRIAFLAALAAVLAVSFAAPAAATPASDARAINAGLTQAVRAGRLTGTEATAYRASVARARAAISRLPSSRGAPIASVLRVVRFQAGVYNRPRAKALFAMLDMNTRYLSARPLPPAESEIAGPGGIVYKVIAGYGLQFHPLLSVRALNLHLYAERKRKALRLARALQLRLVKKPRGRAWEYYFPYGGGSPPWASGMAQAVGAQALARTGRRLGVPKYFPVARQAYESIPGRLVRETSAGPWIRLYAFSDMMVLNAQLQSALSLADFGRIVDYPQAMGLGDRLEDAGRALLGRFDTGYWTNYVPGSEANLKYHLYHVDLAWWLARRARSDFWPSAHARFDRYSREPPVFRPGRRPPKLFPWPADGYRDQARLNFWVSKISTVTVRVGGQTFALGLRRRGWHAIVWRPGRRAPGTYWPTVTAVDLAGNRGSSRIQPVAIAVDTTPPVITASVSGAQLTWSARDRGTPWLRLKLRITRAGVTRVIDLGRRPHNGSLRLSLPRGKWEAVLVAADSSGNRARVALGKIPNG